MRTITYHSSSIISAIGTSNGARLESASVRMHIACRTYFRNIIASRLSDKQIVCARWQLCKWRSKLFDRAFWSYSFTLDGVSAFGFCWHNANTNDTREYPITVQPHDNAGQSLCHLSSRPSETRRTEPLLCRSLCRAGVGGPVPCFIHVTDRR